MTLIINKGAAHSNALQQWRQFDDVKLSFNLSEPKNVRGRCSILEKETMLTQFSHVLQY